MTNTEQIRLALQQTLDWEAQCLHEMQSRIDDQFVGSVNAICNRGTGRLITTGMGKMGFVAGKAAATFSSTGTPAFYLHPGEAGHGDLGAVCSGDVLLALSYSGSTSEIVSLLPYMRRENVTVIGITGNPTSPLGRGADFTINVQVEREADPINTAPTASTTLSMAVCDAIAVALMELSGFTKDDFAKFHPAGSLGRRLLMTVADLMHGHDALPLVAPETALSESIVEISKKAFGCAFVVNREGQLLGIITDGDLRRAFERSGSALADSTEQHMRANPTVISPNALAAEALQKMEDLGITVLPVVENGCPKGILHLHDLVRAGMA
ncbi:MAG: KpsF/GutQ family sugar-phosphate isomerase [Pirellulaceae bacterium]